ncbi:dephospho-CoA kinase [Tundrisphaera sp. TA3]|uniref:dephospho-CoA kinase n=1 Tax=Tundrisphaera sp. TA3 TaxID=3435775 RepID=UPI003EC0BD31
MIGLVGGIGAGKSRVAAEFAARGALILDADKIGHVLLSQRPCREVVIERFGESILGEFGTVEEGAEGDEPGVGRRPIDRKALGAIVFADPDRLRDLEAILHPLMRKTFERAIGREQRRRRVPAVVLDAAILYEAGWESLCDTVVFVDAPREVRLARVAESRGWDEQTLDAREKIQGPIDEKRRRAFHVLSNAGTPEELKAEVDALWPRLIARPRARKGELLMPPRLPEMD